MSRGMFPPHRHSLSWRRRLDDTYVFLEEIRQCRTRESVCACVLACTRRLGVTNVLAGAIPPQYASQRTQLSYVLLDIWPHEWSQRYFSNGYLYQDPTIQLVNRGCAPFLWSDLEVLCKVSAAGRRIMEEANEFNLREGLTLALSTVEGRPIGFSIAGEKLDPDPGERLSLQFVAAYALGCAIAIADGNQKQNLVHLSRRQIDVLHWASEGLTVDEIGERLNISSHTADTHLRTVREKLGVTSTIHAVAEALRTGLIS
ncbi:LuxR family transcriptional regulator [Mesorhizobium sp. M6A.T.Cr.TU.016.01.1.1]|uniref:helix-turn-helix transcriptional regulator n=1 Tax=Mesorhizobium sp. M6A.T.Cr.TU.016.01.1.1 TaxID=2493677 RepID=UPI000F765995|nr:LuxR family transcriptional regulator [Mesorhizobium sp. M6A.T.Cr.TU.016.01.1.1]